MDSETTTIAQPKKRTNEGSMAIDQDGVQNGICHDNKVSNNTNCNNMKNKDNDYDDGKSNNHDFYKIGLLVFTALYVTFFAGAFFGWGPMQLMLEDDGAMNSRCDQPTRNEEEDVAVVCSAQTKGLLQVHFVGTMMTIWTPLIGRFADLYGPIPLLVFTLSMACVGITTLILSRAAFFNHMDWLLYIAFSSLAIMAYASSVLIMFTGMVFDHSQDTIPTTATTTDDDNIVQQQQQQEETDNHHLQEQNEDRTRVISFLNNLFDSGAITYLGLWKLQQITGLSIQVVATVYLALAMFCFGGAIFFFRKVISSQQQEQQAIACIDDNNNNNTNSTKKVDTTANLESQEMQETIASSSLLTPPILNCGSSSGSDSIINNSIMQNEDRRHQEQKVSHVTTTNKDQKVKTTKRSTIDDDLAHDTPLQANNNNNNNNDHHDAVVVADIVENDRNDDDSNVVAASSISDKLPIRSTVFFTLVVFFACHVCRNLFVLTTAKDFLLHLGDTDDHHYLTIFTLMMPASIAGFPLVDRILHNYGYHAALQLINALAIAHGLIQVFSTNLRFQVLGFIVFSFYRSFLFSVVFSFVPVLLDKEVVGMANGILLVSAGLMSYVNIPLSSTTMEDWDGDFFIPNLFYTIVSVLLCFVAAFCFLNLEKDSHLHASDNHNILL